MLLLYLTYEELKHSDSRISLLWCFVPSRCILPMRNWNPLLDHHVAHCVHVVPYLWGIETFFLFFIVTSMNFVVPYLWGIETDRFLWKLAFYIFGCTLPMRNWNYKNSYIFCDMVYLVVPYLWGIETYFVSSTNLG